MQKICLVTEELAGIGASGGIGAAFYELAITLAAHGNSVDLLFFPPYDMDAESQAAAAEKLLKHRVRLLVPDIEKWVWDKHAYSNRSYGLYEYLKARSVSYDAIHFHDYKGLGYFSCVAKKQGLAFSETAIVVQLHGPTLWTIHSNRTMFSSYEQVQIDFLEQKSIALADYAVSPSQYLFDWLRERNVELPAAERCLVIQNVRTESARSIGPALRSGTRTRIDKVDEIVFFGRHEDRKGLSVFCDAISLISEELTDANVEVTFLGRIGEINGEHSGLYLTRRSKNWAFKYNFYIGMDRFSAGSYLTSNPNSVAVIPSWEENSPYTVLEALVLGKPVITSRKGGGRELIDSSFHADSLCDITAKDLAEKIASTIAKPINIPTASKTPEQVEQEWLDFHTGLQKAKKPSSKTEAFNPKVVFGITHYERPQKLLGAIFSAIRQTYKNIEIVVVDDGSSSKETLSALADIEGLLSRVGGKLLRRENGYLGAARNTIAKNTTSDYLIFLDDDDIALPTMVETLVRAAARTNADIVNCLNLYLDETERGNAELAPERFEQKVAYVPTGGPLSTTLVQNTLGGCTSLISRSAFERIGGYSELYGVGYEDYELYFKALQNGAKIEIAPVPLYLYEVGRPSMLTSTSAIQNIKRVFDACQFDKNTDAWKTLVSVQVHQNTAEMARNRHNWIISTSPYREPIERVLASRSAPITEQVDALSDYAAAIQNPVAKAAWEAAGTLPEHATKPGQQAKTALTQRYRAQKGTESTTDMSPWQVEIRLLIATQREEEALVELLDKTKQLNTVDTASLAFARHIAGAKSVKPEILDELFDVLSETPIDAEMEANLLATLLILAEAGNRQSHAVNLIDQVYALADQEYRVLHGDVDEAVRAGTMPSTRDHYRLHGHLEGRDGYGTVREIARIIGVHKKQDFQPWDIDTLINPEPATTRSNKKAKLKSLLGMS